MTSVYIDVTEPAAMQKILADVNGKPFVWAFRSMTVNVGIYRLINGYLVRTKGFHGDVLELTDDTKLWNTIVSRETLGDQGLDEDQIRRISGMLAELQPLDILQEHFLTDGGTHGTRIQ